MLPVLQMLMEKVAVEPLLMLAVVPDCEPIQLSCRYSWRNRLWSGPCPRWRYWRRRQSGQSAPNWNTANCRGQYCGRSRSSNNCCPLPDYNHRRLSCRIPPATGCRIGSGLWKCRSGRCSSCQRRNGCPIQGDVAAGSDAAGGGVVLAGNRVGATGGLAGNSG